PYPRTRVTFYPTGPAFNFYEPEALLGEHQQIDLIDRPIGCLKFEIGPGAVRVVRRKFGPDEIQRASLPFVARRSNNRPACSSQATCLGLPWRTPGRPRSGRYGERKKCWAPGV